MRAAVLRDLLPFAPGYGIETAMTIDAVRTGYSLRELELELEHRATGRSLGGFLHRARQLRDIARAYSKSPSMILAIDQGTTGTTCLVFDREGQIVGRAYSEFEQHFPRPGWVEHDASEIWEVTRGVASKALAAAGVRGAELDAIGIANQRETVVAWDPATGEPVHHALVWQDRRTAARCDELKEAGHQELVRERTGLVIDPYFSGTKIEWLLDNVEAARGAVFGTIDSWLVFKLTGRHLTDYSNASRTMLFDIRRLGWDPELCELLGVDPATLPEPVPSSQMYGRTEAFGGQVPVAGIAGDQQAALFGQACRRPGMAKNTYGTGSFVLLNAGTEAPDPGEGLLTTVAWGLGDETDYALEAAVFVTGAAVQWLRDGLQIIDAAADTEQLAASIDGNEGVYFVPALTGLGSPSLGSLRSRDDRRADPGHRARSPGPGGAGGDRLPDRGCGPGAGGRRRRAARGPEGRRRGGLQPLADAVPGRCPRRAGRRSADRRDDRAGRRLPGRDRDGDLGSGPGGCDVAAEGAHTSPGWAPRSAVDCSPVGDARWSAPRAGRRRNRSHARG